MHGHKIINQNATHFITMTVVGWIDVFTRHKYIEVILDSLNYCQNHKGLVINAYVIMSNHIHMICYTKKPFKLSDTIRDLKKYTAKAIIQEIKTNKTESRKTWMLNLFKSYANNNNNNKTYQFWQQGNKPMELVSPKWINQKLGYIHINPVRNGIVEKAEDYIYSSAGAYIGYDTPLNIEILDI